MNTWRKLWRDERGTGSKFVSKRKIAGKIIYPLILKIAPFKKINAFLCKREKSKNKQTNEPKDSSGQKPNVRIFHSSKKLWKQIHSSWTEIACSTEVSASPFKGPFLWNIQEGWSLSSMCSPEVFLCEVGPAPFHPAQPWPLPYQGSALVASGLLPSTPSV